MLEPLLQSDIVYAHHDSFEKILEELPRLQRQEQGDLVALGKIASTLEQAMPKRHQGAVQLCSSLRELLQWSESMGESIAFGSCNHLMQATEEVRLRIIAVAMFGAARNGGKQGQGELGLIARGRGMKRESALVHSRGGVVSSIIGSNVVILLPALKAGEASSELLAGFLQVFDNSPSSYRWIVDFSAVEHISMLVLGGLLGYAESLERLSGRLYISWMKENLFPEATMKTLETRLKLTKVGRYWFSAR